jgi:phosphoserine phosphatase
VNACGTRWIFFDCDSTLSAIEGVDELARLRPPSVFDEVKSLTDQAMNGEIPLDSVYGRRLAVIRPSSEECERIGQMYIETIEPTALDTLHQLRQSGWTVAIISGGFLPAILPLARFLGVEEVHAVDLYFAPDGSYAGFEETHPNARNGGKPRLIEKLRADRGFETAVMVGDGVSDLETKGAADLFIGYGGYTARDKVKAGADVFVTRLADVVSDLAARGW